MVEAAIYIDPKMFYYIYMHFDHSVNGGNGSLGYLYVWHSGRVEFALLGTFIPRPPRPLPSHPDIGRIV